MSAAKERAHALLSASGAYRWLNCTPSARLEEQLPEKTSEYAEEGRLAHEIAELKLRKHFTTPMGPKQYNTALKKLQSKPLYDPEMLTHTDAYLEYIQSVVHSYPSPPYVTVEKRLNYSQYVPEGFGTGDCIVIGGKVLNVIDFKYGKGVPVDADQNPQMMLYALGALAEYSMLYAIDTVKMAIVQPRLNNTSEFEVYAEDLQAWGESIKPIAQTAFDGGGEFCSGDWCKFCRAKAQCRARSTTMTALEAFGKKLPPLLTNDEVGNILTRAQTLKAWVADLENYALTALLQGEEISGWKAVEGRSNRQFDDTDKTFTDLIKAGIDEAVLYERKPITLTSVEKLLGKAKFVELTGAHVIKPPGKPTLAPEKDKREAIANKTTAEEAFGQAS
jgi:hypothetical protein